MSKGSMFAAAASRSALCRLSGRGSFERGELYALQGRVKKLSVTDSSASATVRGTAVYRVELAVTDDGELTWSCSCPVGAEGEFCKHCVAVALVATNDATPDNGPSSAVDVVAYLRDMDHERLVEFVLDLADNDERLAARLGLDATLAGGRVVAIPAFKAAIDAAFATGDYVDYRDAYDYAQTIDSALDSLDALLEDGHAEAVVELAEHAVDRLEEAVGYVDDSDGWLSGIAERLGEIHLQACSDADIDPVALAERLFAAELRTETFDVFYSAASTYADVLGDEGLAAYRRLAEAAWARLPELGPGDSGASWSGDRYRITKIMETLAAMTGDVDAQVAVLARDLSSAWQYVRIVDTFREAGRNDDGLRWAESGLAAFGLADLRLVEALAEAYQQAGRGSDAVRLAWKVFDRQPTFADYQRLRGHAERAGEWHLRRDKAIERLRRDTTKRGGCDATELVRVFLDEGDAETAWVEANRAGVITRVWLELAATREADHPTDAIPIYQDDVERAINAKNNDAYSAAVERLAHIGALMANAGQPDRFAPYVADVRARHKPKRNLMKLVDQRGW